MNMIVVRPTGDHDGADYKRRLAQITVGTAQQLTGPIEIAAYDPTWTVAYDQHATKIRAALGGRALCLEHVGSTSVPQLPAKPIIDIVLEVADSAAEPAYAPDLEATGYLARIREPNWFEHRLLGDLAGRVNLHVFSNGCPETERMIRFRDWLRSHPDDRELYAQTKQELAARRWTYMQQYADAKTNVIAAIIGRAQAASSSPDRARHRADATANLTLSAQP
jgi:GrpB-like predicted nucleotidyltransferase (UPF0157 family)